MQMIPTLGDGTGPRPAAVDDYPCHRLPREKWCDRYGLGGFMGHTCQARPRDETWWEHEDAEEGRGHWLETVSGKRFFPLDPRAADIDLRTIAHALGRLCRYGGHVSRWWSVADHSWLLWWHAYHHDEERRPDVLRAVILHDAAEAYILDLVRSIKQAVKHCYGPIEDRLEEVIAHKYHLATDVATRRYVKELDRRVVVDERALLFRDHHNVWAAEKYESLGEAARGMMALVADAGPEAGSARFARGLCRDELLREMWDRKE